MKKSTKSVVAASAAAVLLLGGAGTLAYWTDDAGVDGGTITSGSIDLGAVTCSGWLHTEDNSAVTNIVPGDSVYNDCATAVTLEGDHIGATLDIDDASIPAGALADELDAAVALRDADGDPIAAVTTEGTTPVTARISVAFPYGTVSSPDPTTGDSNGSQNGTAVLDAMSLVAVQTHE